MGSTLLGFSVVAMGLCPIPAYWHEKGRRDLRDAALSVPWLLLLCVLLPFPFLIAARLGMPLQDAAFARIDGWFGFNAATVVSWSQHSQLGHFLNAGYGWLPPFLTSAILIPGIFCRPQAKTFLLANMIAVALAIPCVALLPAIGPWYSEPIVANTLQHACESQILTLRHPGSYTFFYGLEGAGVVCFPSFHVVWAVLCAAAFWGIRWLRVPVAFIGAVITLSTLTSGWHYLADAVSGVIVAAIALVLANRIISAQPSAGASGNRDEARPAGQERSYAGCLRLSGRRDSC